MRPRPRTARALRAATHLLLPLLLGTAQANQPLLQVRPPAGAEVAWRGMLATEGGAVGGGAQFLYPAPGPAGLLVAIFTHAALAQGSQSAQRKREQDEADRVLEPYQAALRDWPASALWQAALQATPGLSADAVASGASAEVLPVFTLAQDQGVLLLDVAVKLRPRAGADAVDATVRVVSSPHDAADALAHWSADDARRLKATAAAMFGHALLLAARHGETPAPDVAAVPMRTHRYRQGTHERSERGQQIEGHCARVVLRNLRGWLMSVPQRPAEDPPCAVEPLF